MLKYTRRNDTDPAFPCPEGMSPALHRLLAGRGVNSVEEAAAFLNPGVGSLLDPMLLSDMSEAEGRIRRAMEAGEPVCVYGDYDVDGVCASAILSGWLRSRDVEARVYLPSRHSEGYGLNAHAIREIAGWAKLLVTVDCGVTSVELVALAKSLGLDVIVTDHHQPPEGALPDCPVVNPLLAGYPFPYLCGAGVAWKLVWALGGEAAAMPWVDVAALATVADVVPLTGENRAIVKLGLDAINGAPRTGIAALIEVAGLTGKPITATAIAFQLAPRLNAGGRLGSAQRSLALVMETDPARAQAEAAALEAENTRRKTVETTILAEAEAQLKGFNFAAHRAIILAGKDWNPGVIGLAASRLVEKYNYPVVLLAEGDDVMTGSCRSIEGVDIHAALTGCADTLERFGGHRQAAGLTLLPDRLPDFRAAMDAWLWANTDPEVYIPVRQYDAELSFDEVTPLFIASLEALQPTGFGNPAPLFRATASVVDARAVGAEGAHLKLTLAQGGRRLGGIAFRAGHRAGELSGDVDALFVPKLNTWMGRTEAQLEVRALSDGDVGARLASKVTEEPRLQCDFLTEIIYNEKIPPVLAALPEVDASTLAGWMAERPQGTLVVTSDLPSAGRIARLAGDCPPDLVVGGLPDDPRAFNAVCVCPPVGEISPGYGRIVLAGVPGRWLTAGSVQRAFRLPETPAWMAQLPDVETMREVYLALMRVGRRPAWCPSLWHLVHMTAEEAGTADITAAASILAMADMGLFRLDRSADAFAIARSDRAKASPEESAVWQHIQRWRGGYCD